MHISKLFTIGQIDYKIGLRTLVPSRDAFTRFDYSFDANAAAIPDTKYVGWCAIGVAKIGSGNPAVYFDAGVHRTSKDVPWNLAGFQAIVTQPDGKTFEVQRGQDEDKYVENAGSGTWTITAKYQGFSIFSAGVVPPPPPPPPPPP